MKAFLLAAGLGTRLRPLTDRMPKAMAPIADGLPLLEHHVRQLKAQGISEFVINLHHLPESIISHFGDGARHGVRIEYSDESAQLLDTAGAIGNAAHLLSDDFLLVYADQLHFHDFGPLIELHRRTDALATITLKRSDLPQNGDLAEIDEATSRVVRWHARPHTFSDFGESLHLNSGLDVLSKRIIRHIPKDRPSSLDREVLPTLVDAGAPIFAIKTGIEILDIGTPEKLAHAQRWYAEKLDERPRNRRALFLDRDGVLLESTPRGIYVTELDQAPIMTGAEHLLAEAQRRGYLLVVVTNQPQISKGLLSEAVLAEVHDRMAKALGRRLDAIYYCPHQESDDCGCRKPKPGMLIRAAREFGIDLTTSWMIGDSDKDAGAALAAGCRSIFVHNEFNAAEAARCAPDFSVRALKDIIPLLD